MNLKDLFVSHKQVTPVTFTPSIEEFYQPLYTNLSRVQRVTNTSENSPEVSEETSREQQEHQDNLNWRVSNYVEYPQTSTNNTTITNTSTSSTVSSEKWINPYSNSKDKWIADMTAAYRRAGLNDNAIKNLIAKNALESGWGKYAQGDFNFGNLTTGSNWNGRYVQGKDKDSKGNSISQKFRAYNSLDEYVADEIQFLTKLYDFNKNDDFETFIGKLQGNNSGKRKYAGVSDYANRVRRVYNSIK